MAGALKRATRAATLDAGSLSGLTALGAAQYRASRNGEAIAPMAPCASISADATDSRPTALASAAAAQWKLRIDEAARTTLKRLGDLLQTDPAKATDEAKAFSLRSRL